jgi:hypothetical protein
MTDFASAPAALPRVAPLDPTKHVNYTLGMVLGVDDFDQEFAYLSGRDRWLARELGGYGTIWGLRVGIESDEVKGPRVNVAPGVAVSPCGQLVCVTPAQCAYLNDWLSAHEQEARALLSSPPSTTLPLHVVLCYRECPTDDVPIPGEPCRTEDTLSAPSRVKDDFRLELRLEAPRQPEEDAVRDFVAWLRQIPVVEGVGSPLADLLKAIQSAAEVAVHGLESPPSSPPSSPPESPLDFLLGAPPPGLEIPAAEAADYFRAALGLWVTELRPALRHSLPGCEKGAGGVCGCGCDGSTGPAGEPCAEDVVLLGTIDLPVLTTAEGDLVAADTGWWVDEARRPYLLHTRLLQELLLGGGLFAEGGLFPAGSPPEANSDNAPAPAPIADVKLDPATDKPTVRWDAATRELHLGIPAGAQGIQGEPGKQFVVAAGKFGPKGGREDKNFGNLAAQPIRGTPGLFFLTFDELDPSRPYVVKGTPATSVGAPPHTFETVPVDDALRQVLAGSEGRIDLERGLFVRVVANDLKTAAAGFAVEISDYTEAR